MEIYDNLEKIVFDAEPVWQKVRLGGMTLNKICLEGDSEFYLQSDYAATTWKIRWEIIVARKKALLQANFKKHENVSKNPPGPHLWRVLGPRVERWTQVEGHNRVTEWNVGESAQN